MDHRHPKDKDQEEEVEKEAKESNGDTKATGAAATAMTVPPLTCCPVCREITPGGAGCRVLPCHCRVCKDCMIDLLARSRACPLKCQSCGIYVLSHQLEKKTDTTAAASAGGETFTVETYTYQNFAPNVSLQYANNGITVAGDTSNSKHNKGKRKLPTQNGNNNNNGTTQAATPMLKPRKTFEQRFVALERFKKVNGHCNVPYMNSEGQISSLAEWSKLVRNGKKIITPEQRQKLQDLGFMWEQKKDVDWKIMFDQLQEYRQKHGNAAVPWEWAGNPKLSRWVHTQRKAYAKNKIRADRRELLDSVGMVWRPSQQRRRGSFTSAGSDREDDQD